ncbi:MAG: 3-deoxy-manno-octulosonate cytidylyltransferase [Pseudomonadales bacterium]|nr:3-deoxy-manno-octulosonate cytidylyltransferase [Pseudomonadales bacterium]
MTFSVIIPARYASSRLPGKPLLDIGGKPMLQHVYEQAVKSQAKQVVIATDDERIETAVRAFGAPVCLTSPAHLSGTDRLEEVARQLGFEDEDIIVNVQGDEPLIPPSNIDQVAQLLIASQQAGMATLSEPITEIAELFDPNAVKLVTDNQGYALYFSRAPIPWSREEFSSVNAGAVKPDRLPLRGNYQRHIGIYAYRVKFLHQFVTWPAAPIETLESLEQLRAMWNGVKIRVAPALESPPAGVDTEADLARVRSILAAV